MHFREARCSSRQSVLNFEAPARSPPDPPDAVPDAVPAAAAALPSFTVRDTGWPWLCDWELSGEGLERFTTAVMDWRSAGERFFLREAADEDGCGVSAWLVLTAALANGASAGVDDFCPMSS